MSSTKRELNGLITRYLIARKTQKGTLKWDLEGMNGHDLVERSERAFFGSFVNN